jgi:hypothetical protein
LRADLQTMVQAYRALTYRGGIDADVETQSDVGEEFDSDKKNFPLPFNTGRKRNLSG